MQKAHQRAASVRPACISHMHVWQCGKVLSGEEDAYHVNPSPHVDPDNAPAMAFKRAIEHCSLDYVDEVKDKWHANCYSCYG